MKTLKLAILAAFVPFAPLAWAQTISNPSFESNTFAIPPGYVIAMGRSPAGVQWATPASTLPGASVPLRTMARRRRASTWRSSKDVGSLSNSVTGLTVGLNYQVTVRANSSIAGGGISAPGWSLNGGAEVPFLPPPAPVGGLNPYSTYSASFIGHFQYLAVDHSQPWQVAAAPCCWMISPWPSLRCRRGGHPARQPDDQYRRNPQWHRQSQCHQHARVV